MSSHPIDLTKAEDRLFKVRKLVFNTYDIAHPQIKGQLRVITVPLNFIQLAKKIQPGSESANIGTSSQTLVSFTNKGKKLTPTRTAVTPQLIATAKKENLTRFYENAHEPWNEFILQGTPPLLVRVKTILTRVEWLTEHVNQQGDPVLWANTNVSLDVSEDTAGESGLE